MDTLLQDFQTHLHKIVELLRDDLKLIRTGRASPVLVENLLVEAYGGETKLKLMELATITTDGPTALVVVPFDPSIIGDIERAILKSSLGLSPQTQGSQIVIRIPPLSQEQREKMSKLISQKVEERKSALRNHRDDVRRKIKYQLEQKLLTEDDKFRTEKEIDTIAQRVSEEMQKIKEAKEQEIMEV